MLPRSRGFSSSTIGARSGEARTAAASAWGRSASAITPVVGGSGARRSNSSPSTSWAERRSAAMSGARRFGRCSSAAASLVTSSSRCAPKRKACLTGWNPSSTARAGSRRARPKRGISDPSRTAPMIAGALACWPIGLKLDGIHHISAITGDAPGNVEFYTSVLGMRMVKRTVNQDEPAVYHLFYADQHGSPGMDLTFFQYPGGAPCGAGARIVHRIVWRVASPETLQFLKEHLENHGVAAGMRNDSLLFADPEGLEHELVLDVTDDRPLSAASPEIPAEHVLLGFDGVRAYSAEPPRSERLLAETLGFSRRGGETWEVSGPTPGSPFAHETAPPEIHPRPGAS